MYGWQGRLPGRFGSPTALLLTVVLLAGLFPWALEAGTGTSRWSLESTAPTRNDGLELGRATLAGHPVLYGASAPFFLFNGRRYEWTEANRVSPLTQLDADGFRQIWTTYRVPVAGGTVRATLSYTLLDYTGGVGPEAQLSSWIDFEGPRGDYRFYWRIDPDIDGRTNRITHHDSRDRPCLQSAP